MNRLILWLSACLLAMLSISCLAKTSMEKVLAAKANPVCAAQLIELATNTIGLNKHRLLELNSQSKQLLSSFVSGVIEYKDRQSHVVYAATKDTQGQCAVTFQETFTVKSPCILVREEVFKKWQYQGKLNSNTMVFKNQRDTSMSGMLSDASDGSYCLVSRHKNGA
ncbi:hypothetical protein J8L98_12620 [Pseudoalteromonas sp. MMG013]|uniref:hypothetical protein n=1 Tax=Pseudoalteromonas sp. MMG013 TaxID=2822687 RepID=UPI001B381840|nr:hypothetical protein [Pseudoalteromonas sp. MMG013]MBQ4862531.1 hypothetical protein [Pseudoalteromonas sp. MMG013]